MRLKLMQTILLLGSLAMIASTCNKQGNSNAPNSPTPTPSASPTVITMQLSYKGTSNQGGRFLDFDYQVKNQGASSIYLVNSDEMPYVSVIDAGTVELHFDVVAVKFKPYMFEAPGVSEVKSGETRQQNLHVSYPFLPSDYFHYPGQPATTSSTVKIKVVQGYGESAFVFDYNNPLIYPDFLKWQKLASSNEVSVSGL